jgi:hypothetical protein
VTKRWQPRRSGAAIDAGGATMTASAADRGEARRACIVAGETCEKAASADGREE